MAYDASNLADPENGDVVVLVITSAKAVASKAKEGEAPNGNVFLQIAAQIVDGPAAGYVVFERIMVKHGKDEVKSMGWQRDAARKLSQILGETPGMIPTEAGEETDTTQALPGRTFEAVLKVALNEQLNRKDVNIARILGPVELA